MNILTFACPFATHTFVGYASVAKFTGNRYDLRALALVYGDSTQTHLSIVLSAGRDHTVRLWDVRSLNYLIATLEDHFIYVHVVAILGVGIPSSCHTEIPM